MDELQQFYKNALVGSLCEPLCDEYKTMWRACGNDKLKLIRLALNQQAIPYFATYCNKGKGVRKGFILREFAPYINGYTVHDADNVEGYTYGLYVDYTPDEDLVVDKDVVHVMWSVGATLVIPETKCPTLYVSNKSKVHIVCGGYNAIKVYLFDTSTVTIEDADDTCDVIVYKYSERCISTEGKYCLIKPRVFNKELKL